MVAADVLTVYLSASPHINYPLVYNDVADEFAETGSLYYYSRLVIADS